MRESRSSTIWAGVISILTVLLVVFAFVWPGVWRYEYHIFQNTSRYGAARELSDGPMCYRVDRLTGNVQIRDVEGWH